MKEILLQIVEWYNLRGDMLTEGEDLHEEGDICLFWNIPQFAVHRSAIIKEYVGTPVVSGIWFRKNMILELCDIKGDE